MDAAGLKQGQTLDSADLNAASQRLLATGVFAQVEWTFDGQDLTFSLTPSQNLYPIVIDNLPLMPGADVGARLHAKLPLYHGKVPTQGGLTDSVCRALEDILATEGIKGTVIAVPVAAQGTQKMATVEFSLTSPAIDVGEIHISENSAPLEPKARQLLAAISGMAYSLEGSPRQIVTYLSNYYKDEGYLEAKVEAAAQAPVVSASAIHVPFLVSFEPGIRYRIEAIHLAPDMLVSQAAFDRQSGIHPGDVADGTRVLQNWEFLARQYHNHGYMAAEIKPTLTFDRERGTVSFYVNAVPGPEYTMGALGIEGVDDDLRGRILSAWKLPTGAVFDEGAIMSLFGTQTDRTPQRLFAVTKCSYMLTAQR